MEGVVLDDPAVRVCKCGGEKLSSGGQRKAVVFFFDHEPGEFYYREADIQCRVDVTDEPGEPGTVRADAGQPDAEPCRFHLY